MNSRRALAVSRPQTFAGRVFYQVLGWFKPIRYEKHVPTEPVFYESSWERAMQDVYGAQWKQNLNRGQRIFVLKKGYERAKVCGRPARDGEYGAEWRENFERIRARLLQQKQAQEAEEKAVSKAEQPESRA